MKLENPGGYSSDETAICIFSDNKIAYHLVWNSRNWSPGVYKIMLERKASRTGTQSIQWMGVDTFRRMAASDPNSKTLLEGLEHAFKTYKDGTY